MALTGRLRALSLPIALLETCRPWRQAE